LSEDSPKRRPTESDINNESDEDDEALVINTGKNISNGLLTGFEEKFFEIMD
jgi:hypothetical protein